MLKVSKKDYKFFDSFIAVADNICEIARMQEALISNTKSINQSIALFEKMERQGDLNVHNMMDMLNNSFITPLDREDIYSIIKELDNITDSIENTAHRLKMYHITCFEKDAEKMIKLITKCTMALKDVTVGLKDIKGNKQLKQKINQVNVIEYEGDLIFREAVEKLFASGKSTLEVMKWKEIYECLENTLDACEDAANIVESVLMKYA